MMTSKPEVPGELAWTRVSKERYVSGPYTVFHQGSGWLCLFGQSDAHHYAKYLGNLPTADDCYAAAEEHARQQRNGS
jgi:hypothetical protein